MAKFARLVVPGYPHHVTQRGVRRQKTFFDALDYRNYQCLAETLLRESTLEILAYCLMPNHIHAVVVPERPDSLALFFGRLHKQYAQRTNLKYEWTGHLWQNRFGSVVMDEQHTLTALRYVELNPVRSGLAQKPEQWPWSSSRGNLGLVDDPLIPGRGALGIVPSWNRFLSTSENDDDINQLRRQTWTGRPTGTKRFIDSIESMTGRRVRPRKAGRKKK
jgi:putative transposase